MRQRSKRQLFVSTALVIVGLWVAPGCGGSTPTPDARSTDASATSEIVTTAASTAQRSSTQQTPPAEGPTSPSTTTPGTSTALSPSFFAKPAWLGARVLPLRSDGFGEIRPTPDELTDRRFETTDHLPPPPTDTFTSSVSSIPEEVLTRATWQAGCPVGLDELRYVTVSHWGFDGRTHTGELIVNAEEAVGIVSVFDRLHAARFPIEQMRVATAADIDAPPTGDGNTTGSFVCRPVRGATTWSQHAYGLAIDINPFHNPYAKGDVVLPELASAYVDRSRTLPGMLHPDSVAVDAFADIGWSWGGDWNSLKDWMHFSRNGR